MIDINNYSLNSPSFNLTQNIKPKGKESIPFIFNDNLNYLRSLYNSGKLRNVTYDNIQKIILYGSVYLGYDLYVCPDCGKEAIIPHRCHSKFCTTCGSKETKQRAARISSMALDAHHRHVVFTIPDELKIKLNHLKFRTHMIKSYLRDPLLCTCGALMKYEYTYDPFEGGTPNDRQYRERCLHESRRMRMDRRRN